MTVYEIVETDSGLTIAEMEDYMTPEDAALKLGGLVVDPGPFPTYGEAYDALLSLEDEEHEEGFPPQGW